MVFAIGYAGDSRLGSSAAYLTSLVVSECSTVAAYHISALALAVRNSLAD